MSDEDTLTAIALELARQELEPIPISWVSIDEDEDVGETSFLRVIVVYNEPGRRPPAEITSSFTRMLRKRFEQVDESRFPVVTFVPEADANKAARVA